MGFQCCSRPHGNNVFAAIIFSTTAFATSQAASRWCDYVLYTGTQVAELVASNPQTTTGGIGIWSFSNPVDNGHCYYWPSGLQWDTKFNSARVFSIWTTVAGGIVMIILWFTTCMSLNKLAWSTIGFFLLVNTLFEGLTLLILRSDWCSGVGTTNVPNQCSIDYGAKCGIAAIVFWFLSALSVAVVPPPKENTIVVEQRTTTTTTTNPDGTQTVTTKVETTEA